MKEIDTSKIDLSQPVKEQVLQIASRYLGMSKEQALAAIRSTPPSQQVKDMHRALDTLSELYSYETQASIFSVSYSAIKSRVNRYSKK